jgi:hypothetical protein
MHQSILALPTPPPPRATPRHLHSFFARGPGIGTCKVVTGAGNCLPAGHLTLPDVSAMNTCYYTAICVQAQTAHIFARLFTFETGRLPLETEMFHRSCDVSH